MPHREPLPPILTKVRPGDEYMHVASKGRYLVLLVGRQEADLTPVVVYQSRADNEVWTRPAAEFEQRFRRV